MNLLSLFTPCKYQILTQISQMLKYYIQFFVSFSKQLHKLCLNILF